MTKLNIDAARTIIRETLSKAHELGLKPMSVIVLAAGGHGWSEPGDAVIAFALPETESAP